MTDKITPEGLNERQRLQWTWCKESVDAGFRQYAGTMAWLVAIGKLQAENDRLRTRIARLEEESRE